MAIQFAIPDTLALEGRDRDTIYRHITLQSPRQPGRTVTGPLLMETTE